MLSAIFAEFVLVIAGTSDPTVNDKSVEIMTGAIATGMSLYSTDVKVHELVFNNDSESAVFFAQARPLRLGWKIQPQRITTQAITRGYQICGHADPFN
jgi:hypothetical protein